MSTSKIKEILDPTTGRLWTIRIVEQGDNYGREDCLTHDRADALIEFFDTGSEFAAKFPPYGQFVSRYFLTTLQGTDGYGQPFPGPYGLDLQGGDNNWKVSEEGMEAVMKFVNQGGES